MTPEQRRDAAIALIETISQRLDTCRDYLWRGEEYVVAQLAILENIGDNLRHESVRLMRCEVKP